MLNKLTILQVNNGVKVTIYNREYNLKADTKEDEKFLKQIASYVDEKTKGIASSIPDKNFEQIFVLASLNITAELFDLKSKNLNSKKRLNSLLNKLTKKSKENL
ncbi:cell division protein ZapA [Candidatus Aerophobetes bacterium]|nr:cell division protein ZapA [Candidatus Aerophobetes bacterium]